MMARRWLLLLGVLLALLSGPARADNCTIASSDFAFASVSSISSSDVYASRTFVVTCNWTNFLGSLLTPNVTVCLTLGGGTNSSASDTATRQLSNGGAVVANYNIYTDASYSAAKVWGGWAGTNTASQGIAFQLVKSGGVGSLTQNVPLYARLSADATLAANAVGVDNAAVTSNFGAGSALMQYQFSLTGVLGCLIPTGSVAIPFQVSSTVINDCNISIGNLAFPDSGMLSGTLSSSASMSLRCSKSTLYRLLLSSGVNSANPAARRMKNVNSTETVLYQLLDAPSGNAWGDGNNGTTVVSGQGDGTTVTKVVYGKVPSQSTPSPGDYKDTVTVTVQF
ncbi:fimbrial major subunit CsuA/B family protein [Duganella sp. FT80W]|uniref:Fimbrial major subunit CsuA/B family protein n=1 Tax=Duganella guangzhouensis TaxID=2666084 RepID=A0A6I2L6K0_9BURK|nr:spore coat U domain-containing protein [Duganella guangzhouensis]MRW93811.1 fimbrial major subunit CsuA/B family protein [Duganella guangzhouensis]